MRVLANYVDFSLVCNEIQPDICDNILFSFLRVKSGIWRSVEVHSCRLEISETWGGGYNKRDLRIE